MGFPCGSAGKESACNAGNLDLIPELGRSPGEGNGSPLQYSGLENSMDSIVQFSSVTQSCLTLCDPMDYSTPVFPVHHQLLKLVQSHVHRVGDAIQPSHPLISFSSRLPSSPALGSFTMSQFFTSGGQSTGVLASASVLPRNIQE